MNPRMSDRTSSLLLVGREYLIIGLAAVVIIAAVLLAAYGVHIYLGLAEKPRSIAVQLIPGPVSR
jgi:hypothetical protein